MSPNQEVNKIYFCLSVVGAVTFFFWQRALVIYTLPSVHNQVLMLCNALVIIFPSINQMKGVVKSQMEAVRDIDLWELDASPFNIFSSHFTVIFRFLRSRKRHLIFSVLWGSKYILSLKMNIYKTQFKEIFLLRDKLLPSWGSLTLTHYLS